LYHKNIKLIKSDIFIHLSQSCKIFYFSQYIWFRETARTQAKIKKGKSRRSFNKLLNTLLLYKCLIFLLDKKNRQTEIERNTFFVTFFDQEHQDRRITFYHFLSYTTNKLFFYRKSFSFLSGMMKKEKERKK
jgi:hypothetical protein